MDLYAKGLGFPLKLGSDHGLDVVSVQQSVRAMLEQILFTAPGERVNRPSFGVGVPRQVFETNSPLLAERLRLALDENVYNYLGTSVRVQNLEVTQSEAELHIYVTYEIVGTVSGTQEVSLRVPVEPSP